MNLSLLGTFLKDPFYSFPQIVFTNIPELLLSNHCLRTKFIKLLNNLSEFSMWNKMQIKKQHRVYIVLTLEILSISPEPKTKYEKKTLNR
jgi:hypothetical protein